MSSKDATSPPNRPPNAAPQLYPLVLEAVQSRDFDHLDEKNLIEHVREQFQAQMKKAGFPLPQSSVDGLDVEIRDSLKAIIYGFYSVKEYNDRRSQLKN